MRNVHKPNVHSIDDHRQMGTAGLRRQERRSPNGFPRMTSLQQRRKGRKRRIMTTTPIVTSLCIVVSILYGEISSALGPPNVIANNNDGLRSSSLFHLHQQSSTGVILAMSSSSSSSSTVLLLSKMDENYCDDDDRNATVEWMVDTSTTSTTTSSYKLEYEDIGEDPTDLQAQAAQLRTEADALRQTLEEAKQKKRQREIEKIDKWIEELLVETKVDANTDLLKTVDGVFERLMDDRYSAEQVNKIFTRLCDIRQQESRSDCSPLMGLLVDAAGKLDCMDREENPNKRWNGKVERTLRKKLFARDWNIQLDDEDDDSDARNPWRIR
jgi:hypothetical protein